MIEGGAATVRTTSTPGGSYGERWGGRSALPYIAHNTHTQRGRLGLGLYKILVYMKAFVHESIILLLPPPTCIACTIAILLHVYCAIYDAPPTPLLYAIHYTILATAISCEGQIGTSNRCEQRPSLNFTVRPVKCFFKCAMCA